MEHRELLDDVARAVLDVGVVRAGKSTAGRHEILEHHDVAAAIGLGEPHARHSDAHLAREVTVEPRLGDAHPGVVDERTLLLVERRQLHEHARRHVGLARQRHPRPTGGPGAAIDDGRVGDVAAEHQREPVRVEVVDLGGQRGAFTERI